jgi:hypothetical protein
MRHHIHNAGRKSVNEEFSIDQNYEEKLRYSQIKKRKRKFVTWSLEQTKILKGNVKLKQKATKELLRSGR